MAVHNRARTGAGIDTGGPGIDTGGPGPARFAEIALTGLFALGPGGQTLPSLALELGLSAWMRLAGVGTEEARDTLSRLRGALLEAAGLEEATEPVPLVGRDPRGDTLTLAAYLGDLLVRALRVSGSDRALLVAGTLERLGPWPPRSRSRAGDPDRGSEPTGTRQISSTDLGVRRSMTDAASSRPAPTIVKTRCHQLK